MNATPGNPAGRPGYDVPGEEWYAATQTDRPPARRPAPPASHHRQPASTRQQPASILRIALWMLIGCGGGAVILAAVIVFSQS